MKDIFLYIVGSFFALSSYINGGIGAVYVSLAIYAIFLIWL